MYGDGGAAMSAAVEVRPALIGHLKDLRLPTVRECYEDTARRAGRETLSYEQYLLEVISRECEQRRKSRVQRRLKDSALPLEKSLQNFDLKRLPAKAARQLRTLLEGSLLDRKENVLVFGNPGSGKSHLLTALAQELVVARERTLRFTKCALLMQDLLAAKRDLRLSREIKRLARYDGLIIDDLGYLQQSRDDMEVVFTLLAERYERGSVLMTSNLPFSKWEAIFKDAMMTAAAIDRLVHHSVIIELNIPSYRVEHAKKNQMRQEPHAQVAFWPRLLPGRGVHGLMGVTAFSRRGRGENREHHQPGFDQISCHSCNFRRALNFTHRLGSEEALSR